MQVSCQLKQLEEDAASYLDDALAATATRDLAEGATRDRRRRTAKIYEVEDIGDLTTDLEVGLLEDVEVPEERSIYVPVSGIVELRGTGGSE